MDSPPRTLQRPSRRLSNIERSDSHRMFRKYFSDGGFQEAEWSTAADEALKRCLAETEVMAAKCARADEGVAVRPRSYAVAAKNYMEGSTVEASLNAKALRNCIGEKKDAEDDRDEITLDYEDMLYRSGDLDVENKELEKSNKVLQENLQQAEQKVKELIQTRKILDEENKCLKMQLSRERHQQCSVSK
ncbi:uncharacterized protein [Typha angustifolia]|uniref:uncharacterized protein isoform X2 n=1 Tax=Typha angustifolia TaxID=59011 RepID=UPI003C2E4F74